jgi:proline-rich protein PRCC
MEVSQAQLTAGRDRLVATKNVTGAAFGPEAEARLRAEAGPKPNDVQRRKHQIGSLLYDAKMQEVKMMEGRLQGLKTKRETMARYGW